MRVLHFGNVPFSIDQLVSGGSQLAGRGGWIAALLGRLLSDTDLDLAYAAFGKAHHVEASRRERLDCFVIPSKWDDTDRGMKACRDLVESWKPDLLHIHGTEKAYGLLTARRIVRYPAVISIQGLLGPCSEWYHYFGNRGIVDVIRMHRFLEFLTLRGQWIELLRIRNRAKREREIICGNRYFMGRTHWDRAYIRALNQTAVYYQERRLLRGPFWHRRWAIDGIRRGRMIFTNAGHPRKGIELLLDAVCIIKSDFPNAKVFLAGNISRRSGYGRYVLRKFKRLGDFVVKLGPLDAGQLTEEMVKSHVFVHPSYIDNSPNALSEAQLLGMPIVATYTGGVPTLIQDGLTGLFCPTGDSNMLAGRIREILEDDALAMRLGDQAHEDAAKRHEPKRIISEVLRIYEDILGR